MSDLVLFVDEHLLVVNKPTHLLCVPGRGPDKQDCLLARLQLTYGDGVRVVHRLDMDTSGVMLFARTVPAQRELSRQFEKREVHKQYVALITGSLAESIGCVDAPMRKDMTQRLPPRHIIDWEQGKSARTHWAVFEPGEWSRVRLTPETGRSHQLRVHMNYMGCPIVGDPIYGEGQAQAPRLMLHAESIEFRHPLTAVALSFAAPVPF